MKPIPMIRNHAGTLAAAAFAGLLLSACDDSAGPETTLQPLRKWSFSGQEITYGSGIAVPNRDSAGNPAPGLTVWLTDQAIDCSDAGDDLPGMSGGWIGIDYPETSLGKGLVRVLVGYWPDGPGPGGNIDNQGTASLSRAGTSDGDSVSGSIDFHSAAIDPEGGFGKADVAGSFSVPYCPNP